MSLRESIDRFCTGLADRGWTIDDFLALRSTEIIEFARSTRIPTTDLQAICELMMQELDDLVPPCDVRDAADEATQSPLFDRRLN